MDGEWSKYHWNLKRRKKLGKIQSGGRGTEKQSDRSGEKEEKRSGGGLWDGEGEGGSRFDR